LQLFEGQEAGTQKKKQKAKKFFGLAKFRVLRKPGGNPEDTLRKIWKNVGGKH
jgi:hypothetical protein